MNLLIWLDKFVSKIEGWFIVLFLWIMVIMTFIQVCLRALYTHGHFYWANTLMGYLDWSESLVRLLVLWLTFLGASLVTGENKHIRIDLLSSILPPRFIPYREFILSIVCMLISGIMLKVCLDYLQIEITFGGTMFLGLPNWLGQLILPVGFALILFHFSIRAINQGKSISNRILK
jgi:TRAP-type C4-dicarboxylate transport system permease small subunit